MFLAVPLIAGLLLGKLTGGRFRVLAETPVRGAWMFLIAFATQIVLYTPLAEDQQWNIQYGHAIYVASLLLLLGAVALNVGRFERPILIVAVGAVLNFIVIASNGGAMPADGRLLVQSQGQALVRAIENDHTASNVTVIGPTTRLSFLGDRMLLPGPLGSAPMSAGDILIGCGGFLLAIAQMRVRRPGQTAQDRPGYGRLTEAAL